MSDELVLTESEGTISVPAATLSQIVARAVEPDVGEALGGWPDDLCRVLQAQRAHSAPASIGGCR